MIRSKSATWFETKVRFKRVMDDGMEKTVTEAYVVDALSWGEAEKRITEETLTITNDFKITDIKPAAYGEIFFSDSEKADKFYKCKLQFITIDETSAKEKRNNVYYLVQAENIDKAKANIDEAMRGTMIDYEVVSVVETKLLEVFEYHSDRKVKPSASAIKAAKNLRDSVPDGMKVTMSYSDGHNRKDVVIADKTQSRKEIPKNE